MEMEEKKIKVTKNSKRNSKIQNAKRNRGRDKVDLSRAEVSQPWPPDSEKRQLSELAAEDGR